MRKFALCVCVAVFLLGGSLVKASIFGKIQGIVHDPQHRPVAGASVKLQAITSDWSQTTQSDDNGEFSFTAVPLGDYKITVAQSKFQTSEQTVTVASGSAPILHFQLAIATVNQTTVVVGQAEVANVDSVTPTTLLSRQDIQETPGADRTNAWQMITDYVPAAYVTHDMLHMRGGHQVDWLIDGVPIPNTNIAANLGPVIDPKDIDYLEVQRGSYDADYGDRTYGIFNIVPRTGFERDKECDLVTSLWKFLSNQRPNQLRRAHPAICLLRQRERKSKQLRTADPDRASFSRCGERLRGIRFVHFQSRFQEPISAGHLVAGGLLPDPLRSGSQLNRKSAVGGGGVPSYGLRDGEHERDGYVAFSWVHTFNPNTLLTVSPFYHYNSADYQGGANDYPVISTTNQAANYGGLQATLDANVLEKRSSSRSVRIRLSTNTTSSITNSRTAVKTSPPLRLA